MNILSPTLLYIQIGWKVYCLRYRFFQSYLLFVDQILLMVDEVGSGFDFWQGKYGEEMKLSSTQYTLRMSNLFFI